MRLAWVSDVGTVAVDWVKEELVGILPHVFEKNSLLPAAACIAMEKIRAESRNEVVVSVKLASILKNTGPFSALRCTQEVCAARSMMKKIVISTTDR